jgi:hypothetical protein
MLHTYHLHINTTLIRRTSGRSLGTSKCNALSDIGKHSTKYTAYCLTRFNYAFHLSLSSYLYTTSLTSHHGVPQPPRSTVFANFMSSCNILAQRPGYCKHPCGQLNVTLCRDFMLQNYPLQHSGKYMYHLLQSLEYLHFTQTTYSVRLTANRTALTGWFL